MLLKTYAILAVFAALFSGIIYQNNPVLFGTSKKDDDGHAFYDHTVYEYYPHLDDELFPLSFPIGHDFGAYRNHCLRVLTFTNYFYEKSTNEEDLPDAMNLAATAIAYLQVGLWTDTDPNYIASSEKYLVSTIGAYFTPKELNLMQEIIRQQHKITDYNGLSGDAENALVNAVRKATWVDATMGLFRFDLSASLLEITYDELEPSRFHAVFWRRFTKLSLDIMNGVMVDIMNGVMAAGEIVKW